jgi:hypothetical protein
LYFFKLSPPPRRALICIIIFHLTHPGVPRG